MNAAVLLTLIVGAAAEAPYNYQSPQQRKPHLGYNYQQPQLQFNYPQVQPGYNNLRPQLQPQPGDLQLQPQQQLQLLPRPQPEPQPQLDFDIRSPALQPISTPQPISLSEAVSQQQLISQPSSLYGIPQLLQPGPNSIPQPSPQPPVIVIPQPKPILQTAPIPQPSPSYGPSTIPQSSPVVTIPQAQVLPQPQPVLLPQPTPLPQFIPLPQSGPQLQPVELPQQVPQPQFIPRPQPQLNPLPQLNLSIQPLPPQPQLIPQPLPALPQIPQPLPGYQYIQQRQHNERFTSQQSQQVSIQPLQRSNAQLSSYHADSNHYSSPGQIYSGPLDETVVSRVQDILRDNERSSARNLGYQSLVSGVSLTNVEPSLEILSFVHNSPISSAQKISSVPQGSVSSSSSFQDFLSNSQTQSIISNNNFGFLPKSPPATSYGVPN